MMMMMMIGVTAQCCHPRGKSLSCGGAKYLISTLLAQSQSTLKI